MDVPRPGIKSQLQLQPALQLWQCWILYLTVQVLGIKPSSAVAPAAAVGFLTHCTTLGLLGQFLSKQNMHKPHENTPVHPDM